MKGIQSLLLFFTVENKSLVRFKIQVFSQGWWL